MWVYAILRSIPDKLYGVLAIALVFIGLLSLPYIHKPNIRSPYFRILHNTFYWTFVADCLLLTWLGAEPVEEPFIFLGQLATVWFFIYLLVLTPAIAWLEYNLVLNPNPRLSFN